MITIKSVKKGDCPPVCVCTDGACVNIFRDSDSDTGSVLGDLGSDTDSGDSTDDDPMWGKDEEEKVRLEEARRQVRRQVRRQARWQKKPSRQVTRLQARLQAQWQKKRQRNKQNPPLEFQCHQLTHSKKNLFVCPKCEKEFARKQHCNTHTWQHIPEEEWPVKCDLCNKHFITPSALTDHKNRNHTRVRPLKCKYKYCGKLFYTKFLLKQHQKQKHHGDMGGMGDSVVEFCPRCNRAEPNVCPRCKRAFKEDT